MEKSSTSIRKPWNLRFQQYDLTVTVHKGDVANPVDLLSRHPDTRILKPRNEIAEQYNNFIAQSHIPFVLTKEEIVYETNSNVTLRPIKVPILIGGTKAGK